MITYGTISGCRPWLPMVNSFLLHSFLSFPTSPITAVTQKETLGTLLVTSSIFAITKKEALHFPNISHQSLQSPKRRHWERCFCDFIHFCNNQKGGITFPQHFPSIIAVTQKETLGTLLVTSSIFAITKKNALHFPNIFHQLLQSPKRRHWERCL